MHRVFFTRKSEKDLQKLSPRDAKRVITKIQKLNFPFPANLDIKNIVGVEEFYRLRIGKIRVIFEIDKKRKEIWIRKIGYRGGIYN